MPEIQIGLNDGWTNDDYHGADGVSKSHLDDIAPECGNTPRHYWAKRIDPAREPEEKTEALIIGDAYHVACLEPDIFHSRFICVPEDAPKKPSSAQRKAAKPAAATLEAIDYWDGFAADNAGRTVLKPDDMATVLKMRDVLLNHPVVGAMVRRCKFEQTYFAKDPRTGALIKCKLDGDLIESDALILDLKSTTTIAENPFGRDATKYRYPVQGVWYPHVIHSAYDQRDLVRDFCWIAQEKDWPHAVGWFHAEEAAIREAAWMASRDLDLILQCREAEAAGDPFAWPDLATESRPLRIKYYR